MQDLMAGAAAWIDAQRRAHLSRIVSYRRGDVTAPCPATVSQSSLEVMAENGVVERWESRDFVISIGDLPFGDPMRGDIITETLDGDTVSYAVVSPPGMPFWRYADAFRKSVRIHTNMRDEV